MPKKNNSVGPPSPPVDSGPIGSLNDSMEEYERPIMSKMVDRSESNVARWNKNHEKKPFSVPVVRSNPVDSLLEDANSTGDNTTEHKDMLLSQMRKRCALAVEGWRNNHQLARESLSFAYESQWSAEDLQSRDKQPSLELNMIPQYINHIRGNATQNKMAIQVNQTGGLHSSPLSNVGGTTPISKAEIIEGIIRDIESRSNAHHIYTRAIGHAADGGFGWMRVLSVQKADDPFNVEPKIELISDRFSVLTDTLCHDPDMSDMNYTFISEQVPKSEFEAMYPGKASFMGMHDGTVNESDSWWTGMDNVVVSEYWYREPIKRVGLRMLEPKTKQEIVVWEDETKDILDELLNFGFMLIDEIEGKYHKVKFFKTNGFDILDNGPNEWPGHTIPLIFVPGRQVDIGGRTNYLSVHHYAKDAQRMHNYWMSAATERVALTPKAKFLATPGMVDDFLKDWVDAPRSNQMLLRYNNDPEAPGQVPQLISPPTMPHAELSMAMETESAVQRAIGLYNPSLGQKSNETSGTAIRSRQSQGEIGTVDFSENLAVAIARVGKILIEIIPTMFADDKIERIIGIDGTTDQINLNHKVMDEETNTEVTLNNLRLGRYGIRVSTGPPFETQRQEAMSIIGDMARNDPEGFSVARDLMIEAIGFPGGDKIAKRFKSLLPPHLLSDQEKATIQQQEPIPPDPEMMLKSAAEERQQAIDAKRVDNEGLKQENALLDKQIKLKDLERDDALGEGGKLRSTIMDIVAEMISSAGIGVKKR